VLIMDYTPQELMVTAAAREIRDGEVVFVGMRLPLLAFFLAKATHAPGAVGLFENGILRDSPATGPIHTMSDPPNNLRALMCTDMIGVMGLLQRGVVDLGFIGGAEVDPYGNMNTSCVQGPGGRELRLPGSGGACDIACLSRRLLIIMAHEKRRFVPRVHYVTSPGYGSGGRWRQEVGLPRGGPAAIITTLGILRFDPHSKEAYLASVHPGVTVQEVLDNTGWPLNCPTHVPETVPPDPEVLKIIRKFDPHGFWTR